MALALALSALHASSNTPVADAVMKGDTAAVKALLKEGSDVNAAQGDGMTALHWAARSGDADLARILLFAGANVQAITRLGSYTPVRMAAELGHPVVSAALICGSARADWAMSWRPRPIRCPARTWWSCA